MYDLLMKWGLESLSKATLTKSDQDMSVMLEAIKVKNVLVAERFKFSWQASQSIVNLALEVEESLETFRKEIDQYDWSSNRGNKEILNRLQIFHATHVRRLKKLRCEYDATNDLLSAYSSVFDEILHLNTLEDIAKSRNLTKRSDVLWLYRGLWLFYTKVMNSLVRVTSSDLRFWLTDEPYIEVAFSFAEKDLERSKIWLSADPSGERFYLSLETSSGLEEFWKALDK